MRLATTALSCSLLAAALFGGCGEDLETVSEVTKLRVLGVQAEPPEIGLEDGTTLRVLIADPVGGDRPVEVMWMAFPGLMLPTAESEEMAEGMVWIPENHVVDRQGPLWSGTWGVDEYVIPPNRQELYEQALEWDPELAEAFAPPAIGKVTVFVLVCAGGRLPDEEEMDSAMEDDTGEMLDLESLCLPADHGDPEVVLSTKTFDISDSADPNRNPTVSRLEFNEFDLDPLAAGGSASYVCTSGDGGREGVPIAGFLTEDSFQTYEDLEFDKVVTLDERLYVSWFITGGEFDAARSGSNEPVGPYETTWLPPREGGTFNLWAVAHDIRGGVSWEAYSVTAIP